MKTININGKEYTKEQFKEENSGLDAFIDYWDWEAAVDSSFDALLKFPCHEPEPPTVRPMSELPEDNEKHYLFAYANIKNLNEIRYVSLCRVNAIGLLASWGLNFRIEDITSLCGDYTILGWLYELPNPNEKL